MSSTFKETGENLCESLNTVHPIHEDFGLGRYVRELLFQENRKFPRINIDFTHFNFNFKKVNDLTHFNFKKVMI